MKKIRLFTFLISMLFLFKPIFALAGFDFYVEEGSSSKGDGSKDKPFNKIQKALDAGGKKIYVKNGDYNEDVKLEKKVEIEGESKGKTTIKGRVYMKNDSELKNLTVTNGGIIVENGCNVKIDKVKVKNSSIGIHTMGNGNLIASNCEITENGKGFYLEKDKDIDITNSEITNNDEEGIDIRDNVDGIIKNNLIKDNNEGGIEVIAGGSELTISNNTIKGNKASGIAIQYYEIASKIGGLKIYGNSISSNGNYGIVCKHPSGGGEKADYWTKSVNMGANDIFSNKEGSFDSFCKFSDDLKNMATKTEEELEQEKKVENEKKRLAEELKKKAEEEAIKAIRDEEIKKAEEEEKIKQERLEKENKEKELEQNFENIKKEIENKNTEATKIKQEITNQSKTKTFFFGSDNEKLNELSEKNKIFEEYTNKLENIKNEVKNEEIKKSIESKIDEIKNKENEYQNFIEKEKNRFGLFIWFTNLFKKIF